MLTTTLFKSLIPLKTNNKAHWQTGLYYYGARYYNPRISNWLSVDPLAEHTMTPYQYTYQNPVKYIDPTGMAAEDPPTHANRNNHNFKLGGEWIDNTGKYTVAKITEEGVEWSSMNKSHVDSDGEVILIHSTHKTKFRSKFGQWWYDTFTRKGDRGYSWQGNAPQTFLYVYSLNGGNPSVGDRGFFKDGDKIIDINFDEFITPMNYTSKATNSLEVIDQFLSTLNHSSNIGEYFGELKKEYKYMKHQNDTIKIMRGLLGTEGQRGIFYNKTFKVQRKDSIKKQREIDNYNDSIQNILKTRL